MKQLTKILKVLADTNRLRILKLLEKRKLCVCELAFILGITQPSTSRHLKKLKAAGLICDEQEGLWTNYILNVPNNEYGKELTRLLNGWLNDDAIVKADLARIEMVNRTKLCCAK